MITQWQNFINRWSSSMSIQYKTILQKAFYSHIVECFLWICQNVVAWSSVLLKISNWNKVTTIQWSEMYAKLWFLHQSATVALICAVLLRAFIKSHLNTGSGDVSGVKSVSRSWPSWISCTAAAPAQLLVTSGTCMVRSGDIWMGSREWKPLRNGDCTTWAYMVAAWGTTMQFGCKKPTVGWMAQTDC